MHVSLFTDGEHTGCVRLQAPKQDENHSPPRVVVGVLDGSGSMDGKPLQDAKLALQWVVRQLRPNVDSFGLVYFSNEAKLQIPVTVVTDTNSLAMRTAIASLQTTGSTNLEAGLRLALEQIPEASGGSLVLATDGIPNRGATSALDLVALVRDQAATKTGEIRLDTAGLGPRHNEDLLTSLASELDGVYTFLESSAAIQDWAATRLGDALTVSARQVECTVHGSVALRLEGVSAVGQTVHYPTLSAGEVKHILVTLAEGTPLSVTVEYLDNDGASSWRRPTSRSTGCRWTSSATAGTSSMRCRRPRPTPTRPSWTKPARRCRRPSTGWRPRCRSSSRRCSSSSSACGS